MLSVATIYLSATPNKLANKICDQLNLLYLIDLFVTIIDFRSYYILGSDAGMGYSLSFWTGIIDLLLIIIIINETRLAPTKPVITEEVRLYILKY